jgi:flagellar motor switch protein FliN/FliY
MSNENLSQEDIDALLAGGIPADSNPSKSSASRNEGKISHLHSSTNDMTMAQKVEFSQLPTVAHEKTPSNIDLILDVNVEVTAELGRKTMYIKDILEIGPGSVIELNKLAGEPVDLLVNSKLLARGEVVVINENFGIRIIDIVGPAQRIKNLR